MDAPRQKRFPSHTPEPAGLTRIHGGAAARGVLVRLIMFHKIGFFALVALVSISPLDAVRAAPLADAQIAHIAYTAGQIDIDAAQLALSKDVSAQVRQFAETMARDHAAVNERALALVKKLGVTPEDNATSQALLSGATETERTLRTLSGAAFDRAYVANEVAFHQTVNDALRQSLIPGANNAELKALLVDGLALFSEHQKHAEMLQRELAHHD